MPNNNSTTSKTLYSFISNSFRISILLRSDFFAGMFLESFLLRHRSRQSGNRQMSTLTILPVGLTQDACMLSAYPCTHHQPIMSISFSIIYSAIYFSLYSCTASTKTGTILTGMTLAGTTSVSGVVCPVSSMMCVTRTCSVSTCSLKLTTVD